MKKILIVGSGNMSTEELEKLTQEAKNKGFVLVTNKEDLDELPTEELLNRSMKDIEPDPLMLTNIENDYGFFSRAKHEPKGHERKYKYHK